MGIVKNNSIVTVDSYEQLRQRDFSRIVADLSNLDAAKRRRAATVLAPFSDAASSLIEHLRREEDAGVREAILMSLTRIGTPEVVAGLVESLREGDAQRRSEVIEAMQRLPETVAPIMSWLLGDKDPDVRIFAVNVLESLRHDDVEKWLIEVLENDENVNVCAASLDLLSETGTEKAVAPLERLKARFPGEPYIVFAVDLALKRIQGPRT
jgi:HEAT repeat protein